MFKVSALNIYPVKSLGGIPVKFANIQKRGFENDRRWMLVDENNVFLSQRSTTELCFFDLTENENSFTILHRLSQQKIELPKAACTGKSIQVQIWDDMVSAGLSGKIFDDFFSSHLKMSCRLVEMPLSTTRQVNPAYAGPGDIVSFTDAYPVLIIGQSSLDLLNSKLEFKIDMARFRPNIIFTGGDAHCEDTFGTFTIGETKLKNVKLCGRCVMPTIDYNKGVFQKEINTVLAKYRSIDSNIVFGINCLVLNEGRIELGQKIL